MSLLKKIVPVHRILLQTLVLVLLMTSTFCASGTMSAENDFIGTWTGHTKQNDDPVDLTVELDKGQISCEFHYGAPSNCSLMGKKDKMEGNTLRFRINESSGGRKCDNLWNGTIILVMQNKNKLEAQIKDKNNKLEDEAILEKQ